MSVKRSIGSLAVLAVTVFPSLLFVGCGIIGGGSPSSVAEKFYGALAKGDMEALGKYATPEMIEEMAPVLSNKEATQAMLSASGKIKAVKEDVDGDTAIVVLKAENKGDLGEMMLVKQNDNWKVHTQNGEKILTKKVALRLKHFNITDDDLWNWRYDYVGGIADEYKQLNSSEKTVERFVDEYLANILGINADDPDFVKIAKSAAPEARAKEQAQWKSWDDIFAMPLLYGDLRKYGDTYYHRMTNQPYTGMVNPSDCRECGWGGKAEMKNGKLHGKYRTNDHGNSSEGKFNNGKQHGKWKIVTSHDEINTITYTEEVKFYKNGVLQK